MTRPIGVEGGTTSEDYFSQALAIETTDVPALWFVQRADQENENLCRLPRPAG